MALSDTTISKLADALVPEVIDYIFDHEIVPDAVTSKIGGMDEDLAFEISMIIMDRIVLKQFK